MHGRLADADDAPTHLDRRSSRPSDPTIVACGSRFELGRRIGGGGMGEIRLAHDSRIGRDVAIKLMKGNSSAARFRREARVQGRLDHPAIVPVYDLGVDEHGRPYFVMKRLNGSTLHEVLARQAAGDPDMIARWPQRQLLARLADVCLAVELAHTRGIVHRDLKPENIMLGEFGEVYVLDWGIARIIDRGDSTPAELDGADAEEQTIAGSVVGTPGYIPPEQARGKPVDARADVYALGCILFEVLTGRRAMAAGREALSATLAASAHRPRTQCPELAVPCGLDDLCAHATAPNPQRRLESARALATGIHHYLDGVGPVPRTVSTPALHARAEGDMTLANHHAIESAPCHRSVDLVGDDGSDDSTEITVSTSRRPMARHEAPPSVPADTRAVVATIAALLAGLPMLAGLAVVWSSWILVLACTAVASLGAVVLEHHAARFASLRHAGLLVRCGGLALAGVVFGPILIVPALTIGVGASVCAQPRARQLAGLVAHGITLLVPVGLELSGLVPRTFSLTTGGLELHPWAMQPDSMLLVVAVALTVMQLVSVGMFCAARPAAIARP